MMSSYKLYQQNKFDAHASFALVELFILFRCHHPPEQSSGFLVAFTSEYSLDCAGLIQSRYNYYAQEDFSLGGIVKTKLVTRLTFAILLLLMGCLAMHFLKSSPGPSNPVVARELIQSIVPATWKIVPANQELIDTTQEYFPDPSVQTLALVGPEINHLRWTDHQGNMHVEDWSKECLLLWIIPSKFKPKFPNFFDQLAGGDNLPLLIFSSDHVCVYGYVTNSGFDFDRFRGFENELTRFSIDDVEPTWTSWAKDIETKLAAVGTNKGVQ